jgi:hypothetical protein
MMRDRALAALTKLYGAGYRSFAHSGKRIAEPEFRLTAPGDGWITRINGESVLFDLNGKLVAHGTGRLWCLGINRRSL